MRKCDVKILQGKLYILDGGEYYWEGQGANIKVHKGYE